MESWAKSIQGSKRSPKGIFLRLHGLGFCPKVSTFLKKLSPKLITTKTDSTTQNPSQHKMGMRTQISVLHGLGWKALRSIASCIGLESPEFFIPRIKLEAHCTLNQSRRPSSTQNWPWRQKSLLKRLHGPFRPLG